MRIVSYFTPNAGRQPPGSRKMLPPSSPLRTGHESFPSSGSSPWPLSPVLLVALPMAPGVYKTFVIDIVCSTLACRENMIRFYAFSHYEWDVTQSASVSLFLVQHQPLFLVGFPSHLLLLALRPVLAQGWVIGGIPPCDLREAGDRGCVGLHQFRLSFPECPITVVPKIAGFHPFPAFIRVSAFRPRPEHLPLGMSNLLKDVFGRTVPVIIRPSPYDRVECLDYLPCRGLLMCVQVGSSSPARA